MSEMIIRYMKDRRPYLAPSDEAMAMPQGVRPPGALRQRIIMTMLDPMQMTDQINDELRRVQSQSAELVENALAELAK